MVRLDSVGRIHGMRRELDPPPRLAQRTCENILDTKKRLRAASQCRSMTPTPAVPHSRCRLTRSDVVVAAVIFLIAGLLVLPAVNGSRFQARLAACKDNLLQVGQALTEYSHKNHDVFPVIPSEGNMSAAGIYAPILTQEGYLAESDRVLCPDSTQAQQQDFRIPSLDEVRSSNGQELASIKQKMGGSYGYCLGYFDHGVYQPTRNLNRPYFAIMADAPSSDRANHQSDNHGGLGQNVLFDDMHVEFCSTTRPGNGNDDIYTNDNNEVAPGLNRDDSVIAPSGTAPLVYVSLP